MNNKNKWNMEKLKFVLLFNVLIDNATLTSSGVSSKAKPVHLLRLIIRILELSL